MIGSVKQLGGQPRVFISYARTDGENFAKDLRKRLEAEGIPLWQDRIGMEGGRDWWLQIVDALEHVEFMVLIMTPAALLSTTVRKEWRQAKQQGVCVYPVQGYENLDFSSLPRWMREVHWYDLDHEWAKFLNDLNTRCEKRYVPFMVEDLPADFVDRPKEFEELIGKLLDDKREEPVAITAALRGAGGYGKTTMAKALCHDPRIQDAFDDGILWVTLGENPSNLIGRVEDLIYMLKRVRPGFTGIDAATAYFASLLADQDILLVIDDVWNETHLKPFLQGGGRCARLITTRDDRVLPADSQNIPVDAMHRDEALKLLSFGLDAVVQTTSDRQTLQILAKRLGEWPLLLKLVNGVLRDRVNKSHQPLPEALIYINKALNKHGLTAFDEKNAQDRSQAVAKTLQMSFELLDKEQYKRYKELAVFPKDIDIPLEMVQKLWNTTAGLDEIDTERLCEYFHSLSLLNLDLATRIVNLHDVIHSYLQSEMRDELAALHTQLLDTYGIKRWSKLPPDEPYLWDHLAVHLISAGRGGELVNTVKDGNYLAAKTYVRSVYAVENDLDIAEKQAPTDVSLHLLKRNIARISHLLNRCETLQEVAGVLHSRLSQLPELNDACMSLEENLQRPFLTSWHPFLELSHAALIRTLQGHMDWVRGCVVSPAGDWIISASYDKTLKVWDVQTGAGRLTLVGHSDRLNGCAISPSGDFIVSASDDGTLNVWDVQTWTQRLTFKGHTGEVRGCAVSPAGDWIVSASSDETLKVWDAQTGAERFTLRGHRDVVNACAVSPAGDWIVSASSDETLKIWDAQTGIERLTLTGHTGGVYGCAVSPAGGWIVSASSDETLKVWNVQTGIEHLTLAGHTGGVYGCAVSPAGDWIVSASYDKTLKVWDSQAGAERLTLTGHIDGVYGCTVDLAENFIVSASDDKTLKVWDVHIGAEHIIQTSHAGRVNGCAVSPLSHYIVSASSDRTLKVWDAQVGAERLTLIGHANWVRSCAVSPAGDWIVSASDDKTLKIWDAQTGAERLTLIGHAGGVYGCAVSPAGDWIVSASDDKTLKVWDVQTGVEIHTLIGHTDWVYGCAVSPMGDYIVSASYDKTLKVWDVRTGTERFTLVGHNAQVWGCAVSPMGDYIVSASFDRTLKIWNPRTGTEHLTLSGHTNGVTGCAVNPAGNWIISTSTDQKLKVWDAKTGANLMSLLVDGELWTCAFCPDGEHLVAGGENGVYFLRLV